MRVHRGEDNRKKAPFEKEIESRRHPPKGQVQAGVKKAGQSERKARGGQGEEISDKINRPFTQEINRKASHLAQGQQPYDAEAQGQGQG